MLFHGLGCFSPLVDASLRTAWVRHGGSIARSNQDFFRSQFFFCAGLHDPWLKESIIVRHAQWISKSVSEQFLVPVSKYILDDHFDPAKFERRCALQIPKPSTSKTQAHNFPLQERLLLACRENPAPPPSNSIKRPLETDSCETSIEVDPRPLKRARIQPLSTPDRRLSTHDLAPALQGIQQHLFSNFDPLDLLPQKTRIQPASSSSQKVSVHTLTPVSPTLVSIQPGQSAPASPLALPTPHFPRPAAHLSLVKLSHHMLASTNNDNHINATGFPRRIDFTKLKPNHVPMLSLSRPSLARFRPLANTGRPNDANVRVRPRAYRTSFATLLRAPRPDACAFAVDDIYQGKIFTCTKISDALGLVG